MRVPATKLTISMFAIATVVGYASHFWQWGQWRLRQSEHPRPSVADLAKQLKNFPYAESTSLTNSFDRSSSVGAVGTLINNVDPREIVAVFKDELLASGWRVKRETTEPYPSVSLCRGGISAAIEPVTTPNGTRTHVGVTWSYYTASSSYCP